MPEERTPEQRCAQLEKDVKRLSEVIAALIGVMDDLNKEVTALQQQEANRHG
jgi:hypothetical protein